MGRRRSCSGMALAVSALILLHFLLLAGGSARRTAVGDGPQGRGPADSYPGQGKSGREMVELDYEYPGPNVNDKSGYLLVPAAPPPLD